MSEPVLSVCLITYNHARYIKEAIDSVLMQKVNFSWELIIADDFSTDGTREIVLTYKKRYPEFIRLILQEKNVGAAQNWLDLLAAPSSKYIAYVEGDDYWTDPRKLQRQVDFLENHPEYVVCFHNSLMIYEDQEKKPHPVNQRQKETLVLEDFIRCDHFNPSNPITSPAHTASVVFRNGLIPSFPDWFYQSVSGDLPLYMLLAEHGKGKYFDDTMSVYRIHSAGISSSSLHGGLTFYTNRIKMYMSINRHFSYKYAYIIRPIIAQFYIKIFEWGIWSKQSPGLLLKSVFLATFYNYKSFAEIYHIIFQQTIFLKDVLSHNVKQHGIRHTLSKIYTHFTHGHNSI